MSLTRVSTDIYSVNLPWKLAIQWCASALRSLSIQYRLGTVAVHTPGDTVEGWKQERDGGR